LRRTVEAGSACILQACRQDGGAPITGSGRFSACDGRDEARGGLKPDMGDRAKILCIDDTVHVRQLVQRLLSADYTILEADDGLQGIDLAEAERPDLVLVDLHMPGLTGYEVATRIKSILPGSPVIALSADVTDHVRERALASGCDGYLSKPIDPDQFVEQVAAYLSGAREFLEDDSFREGYQRTLVARLEENVRGLTEALDRNARLNAENLQLLERAQRQTALLEAGARVSRSITSILDLEQLLSATVEAICGEFGFYYAGVFLVSEDAGRWAVLRAGRAEAGKMLVAEGHRLKVGGDSMVGLAIAQRRALVALDVGQEPVHFQNPHLPETRSEMALPLILGATEGGVRAIGALTVQSTEEAAFGDDDVAALQIVADQLAVAIGNARALADLERTHQELARTRTYEAIANATGEAIHWVGNKAAPIPGSVTRVTEDVVRYLCMANALLDQAPAELRTRDFARLLARAAGEMEGLGFRLDEVQAGLEAQSLERLRQVLSFASIHEDLQIIERSARAILNIKEDLIGPVRQHKDEIVHLPGLLEETIAAMGIPEDIVRTLFAPDLLPVRADPAQLACVFTNLVKNALEAMEGVADKKLFVWARRADDPGYVVVDVIDNGVGIPPDDVDKVWMAFYTTKGERGGTGLGLPACAQIVGQLNGRITLESEVGLGTTFSVFLPAVADG
jgi:signal transduction histidine kinase/DNA-binding response OmpR family regulator